MKSSEMRKIVKAKAKSDAIFVLNRVLKFNAIELPVGTELILSDNMKHFWVPDEEFYIKIDPVDLTFLGYRQVD